MGELLLMIPGAHRAGSWFSKEEIRKTVQYSKDCIRDFLTPETEEYARACKRVSKFFHLFKPFVSTSDFWFRMGWNECLWIAILEGEMPEYDYIPPEEFIYLTPREKKERMEEMAGWNAAKDILLDKFPEWFLQN
ncbi:MAG: hypothetical protein HY764_03800 [Candidatus Portnoybacteria bacterium]|nr:hypothetical protein [Candidatus Portnoybacteria bacterium]